MFRNLVLSAAAAGLAAGLLTAALQSVTTTPLIVAAERYERPPAAVFAPAASRGTQAVIGTHDHALVQAHAEPGAGWQRGLSTSVATVVTGIGFAFVLLGAMIMTNGSVNARIGLAFGVAGFASFALAPALGLPPEIPGSAAADLGGRQAWWMFTAAATAAGLAALLLSARPWLWAIGVGLLVIPHLVGAPEPAAFASAAPAELAAEFAAASLVVTAVFWAVLGVSAGAVYDQLSRTG